MEFDPESFMDDVHAALQHRSPHSRASVRPREPDHGDARSLDSIVEEGRESMFPASKRRRLSTNTESTSPESFDISEWLTAGNEALNVDTHGGSESESDDDDVPAFFSPSKSHLLEIQVLGLHFAPHFRVATNHLRPRYDNSSRLISPPNPPSNPSKYLGTARTRLLRRKSHVHRTARPSPQLLHLLGQSMFIAYSKSTTRTRFALFSPYSSDVSGCR